VKDVDAHLVGALSGLIARFQYDSEAAQEPTLQEEIEKLFGAVGLRMPLSRATGRGGATKVIRFQDEARWLLAASRELGPDEAVRRLRAFLMVNESSYSDTLLFWGMHPPRMIELANGIELGPLGELPPSAAQAHFLTASMSDEDLRSTDYVTQYPKPRAVLVKHVPIRPIYFGPEGPREEFTIEDKYFLAELMQVFPVVTKAPVIRIAEWHAWPSDAPVVSLDGGYAWSRHLRATQELARVSVDEASLAVVAKEFLALDPVSQSRLRLPLRRFNAFLLTESLSDQAIEAGVALESLLSEPGDPKDGIIHRMAVRAALLTAVELGARKNVAKRVRDIYSLRSVAAHGADLDEVIRERAPWGVEGRFRRPESIRQVLDDAKELIPNVFSAIFRLGSFPEYGSLDLSPDVLRCSDQAHEPGEQG
jgi:hypothetical protein